MLHIEAEAHVRGESVYVDDVPAPAGMLHAAVFGSPVAHGKLTSLNIDAALASDGVAAIITAKDIPGENQIGPIIPDEPLLADSAVHYRGQPVAVVLATSKALARRGVTLIEASIDTLPAITDPREAYDKGEIIGVPRTIACGDLEAAFGNCDVVVSGSCDVGGQEHVYLETQRARAVPIESGRLKVFSSTQSPYAGQRMIAQILGIPQNHVEIDVLRLGGAFGGKEDQATQWACLAALSAWVTGKAVELVLSREEDMRMTGKRHPYKSDFKIGAASDGTILAYQVEHYQNSGAGADLSTAVLERTLLHSTGSYFVPNARIFGACCRTNLPPNTAFRGFGGPQGMFVIESAIAALADKLQLPVEQIQRKNLLAESARFPYGQLSRNDHAIRAWDEATKTHDLAAITARTDAYNAEHFLSRRGYALMPVCFGIAFTTTYMNQASALVHVYTDGSVSVSTGGVEMGQGLSTNMALLAAKALGIDAARVRIESTNTTRIANMSPSAASSTTLLNGNAVILAADQILARLRSVAANMLGEEQEDRITIAEGQVRVAGKPANISWQELVQQAYASRVGLSAHAFYATPDLHYDKTAEQGEPFAYHVCGTAIIEVSLDCLRGTYTVDSAKIVHDLGRPLNESVDLGQIEGGLAQGLGWMSLEDLQYDPDGTLLSSALATYKLPDAHFMPDDIEVKYLQQPDGPIGPYGSKAVGEPPLMYGIALFFALRQAMLAFRPEAQVPFTAPLTPERVLMALYADDDPAELPVK